MAIDFDLILEEVSHFGRYQKLVVYLLCIPACFMNAFGFSFIFAGYTPDFHCVPSHEAAEFNVNYESLHTACSYTSEPGAGHSENHSTRYCTNFTYDQTYFTSTVVTQWNLVCDKSIYPKIMMSIHSLVTLFGCLINSYFMDLCGRKIAFLIVLTLNLIGAISSAFAPNFLVYSLLRSLVAYSTTSCWNVCYTWALEYVGPSKRTMVTTIMCVMYGVAAMSVGGVAWLCDTWVKLTLAGSIPFIALYSYALIVDESPRWLLSRGRNAQALKTVRKMARWENQALNEETIQKLLGNSSEMEEGVVIPPNGIDPKIDEINHVRTESDQQNDAGEKMKPMLHKNKATKSNPGVQDLFRTRNLRWKTLLLTYGWLANLLTYLAIAYNMENLKGNLFVTYTLQAAMEIPSSFLMIFLLDRFGRIPPLCISMVACGLLLFSAVPADYFNLGPWPVVSLTLAAKFGISLSFGILVQLAGESYPTQLRGVGIGFSSFVGTLGSTIMPYVVHSAKVYVMLPMILMGIAAVTSGISVLMLPETKGQYMPETVAEAEDREKVGYAAMKENWRSMLCCRKDMYKAVNVATVSENAGVRKS